MGPTWSTRMIAQRNCFVRVVYKIPFMWNVKIPSSHTVESSPTGGGNVLRAADKMDNQIQFDCL